MVFIHTHMGLGDHILTCGLVRVLITRNPAESYTLFAKHHNYESVSFMYHDEPRIHVMAVSGDAEVNQLLQGRTNVIRIGFNQVNAFGHIPFDLAFYRQMGIDYVFRWSAFKYRRDRIEQERELYSQLAPKEPYIFVHDEFGKGTIRPEYLVGKRVVRPVMGLTANIFDYVLTIEKACEVHCIDSAFMLLIDSLLYLKAPQYFHRYARSYVPSVYDPVPLVNNHWKVLDG